MLLEIFEVFLTLSSSGPKSEYSFYWGTEPRPIHDSFEADSGVLIPGAFAFVLWLESPSINMRYNTACSLNEHW